LLLKLITLLRRFDLNIENHYWEKIAKLIHSAPHINSCKAPKPTPALNLRPTTLSVTEIEKLLRDPYWIYAKKILRLRKLPPLENQLSAADFGNFVHKALEDFSQHLLKKSPCDWYLLLVKSGEHVLKDLLKASVVKSLWWPRFKRLASWLCRENIFSQDVKYYAEVRGKMYFDINGLPFYLQAKADCLIIDQKGAISIIDYKTGALPSMKNILQGTSSQMILEALIAASGGFMVQDLNKKNTIEKIIYIRLTGGEIAGEELIITNDITEMMNQAFVGVSKLISAFYDQSTPYYASPLPELLLKYNDYAHLARNKEWVM
jgi:ATP-dependent helicase/nuclease subunit B